MCGVIVVDAGRSRSTCHGHDAYIHDHCLRCRHNYALFYQLLNSNLFTHRMFCFKREASSETYGSRVYFPSYIFRSINKKPKNTLLQFICFYFSLRFSNLLYLSLSDLILASDREGIDNPFSRCVQVFVSLCRCIYWGLAYASYWIDTLVLN